MDKNSETFSLNKFSIRNETKGEFDGILLQALKKKRSQSKEILLDHLESTTNSNEVIAFSNEIAENLEEEESKRIIMQKFLGSSSDNTASNYITDIKPPLKPPVPKPRKKFVRKDSTSSNGTYNVTSPKFVRNNEENSTIRSNATYTAKFDKRSLQNNGKLLGDVLIHDSPNTSKMYVFDSNSDVVEKADIEDLSDKHSNMSQSSYSYNAKNQGSSEAIEMQELQRNKIEDIDKIKPKPRRSKIKKTIETAISECNEKNVATYEKLVEIIIHRADRLKLSKFILHPVVKVHIVDVNTGEYYKKSSNRPVVFYYENDTTDYILPVMTGCYNLQESRALYPKWEETILLNEDFNYLIHENLILFFEILDFSSDSSCKYNTANKYSYKGWTRIAYAFLKPIGLYNTVHVNKKNRLQLYYPCENVENVEPRKCYVWNWWHNKNLKKYPSTLYVTIKSVVSPKKVCNVLRSKTPLQKEDITLTIDKQEENEKKTEEIDISAPKLRKSFFRLPNDCIAKLSCSEEGCFQFKFSNSGNFLAASAKTGEKYELKIYLVDNFEETSRFPGHEGLIYSINWSKDDKLLITASADRTVAIWDIQKHTFLQILPHPSYVYASDIGCENTIATGCFDSILRIWTYDQKTSRYKLHQELENHNKAYITSVCFNKYSTLLFSADSQGSILEWKKEQDDFILNRTLNMLDLLKVIINQILLFPNEKKLLVHARDSTLRILSVENSCVLRWLPGSQNLRVQTFCSISHCGNYVTCGSENGLVTVWDAKTGRDVKTYQPFSNMCVVHCVQFNSIKNMIAMSHYGQQQPLLIYGLKQDENIKSNDDNLIESDFHNKHRSKRADDNTRQLTFKEVLLKIDDLFK